MSGHSKWSQIKRKKGIKDQQRGQVFSKLSRLITLAVQEGGGVSDPEKNVRLRLAVERARAENMPSRNIERAVARASGGESGAVEEVLYEGFGPQGAALVIHGATDNQNRTRAEVRRVLERGGGKMGGVNSVLYQFEKCGVVVFDKGLIDEAAVFEFADRVSAVDIEETGERFIVYVPFELLGKVNEHLNDHKPTTIDVFYKPKVTVALDEMVSANIDKLIEQLEDLDDVDRVYANVES